MKKALTLISVLNLSEAGVFPFKCLSLFIERILIVVDVEDWDIFEVYTSYIPQKNDQRFCWPLHGLY